MNQWITNRTESILRAANDLLGKLKDGNDPNKYPYILCSAVALECMLNLVIVEWCVQEYSESDYKKQADAFLSMNLRSKLNTIGMFSSKSKYIINNQSPHYQVLSKLISLRNEVAHTKEFYADLEVALNKSSPSDIDVEDLRTYYSSLCLLNSVLEGDVKHKDVDLFKNV